MLVVVGAGVAWMQGRDAAGIKYRLGAVKAGDVSQTVSANGTLNPVVLVNVGTQVSGTVKKLNVDFNDHVKAGQVLAFGVAGVVGVFFGFYPANKAARLRPIEALRYQ